MSQENPEEWESASGASVQDDERNANASSTGNTAGYGTQGKIEASFSKRSQEEMDGDAVEAVSRTSSISSGLARLSMTQLTASQPPQPTPPQAHVSAFPDQFPHGPQHDRTRSPKSSLPDYHNPDSPTQKRGPGIPRNPISDTWRDDAYEKKEAGKEKIVDVAKKQDRWRCEYCNHLNERGITQVDSKPDKGKQKKNAKAGDAKPSKASPHSTSVPIKIPGSDPPGIAPDEQVKCARCGEQMFVELSRYDPREPTEDGVRWRAVEKPEEAKALKKEVAKGTSLKRVRERWKKDAQRSREEARRKSIGESSGGRIEEEGEAAREQTQGTGDDEVGDENVQAETGENAN